MHNPRSSLRAWQLRQGLRESFAEISLAGLARSNRRRQNQHLCSNEPTVMTYEHILYQIDGPMALITINRAGPAQRDLPGDAG